MKNKLLLLILCCFTLFATKAFSTPTAQGCVGDVVLPPPCVDSISTYFPGGVWSSSDEGIAIVNPVTGAVTILDDGSVTITYTRTGACGNFVFSYELVANPPPTPITGTALVCVGGTTTVNSTPSGGTWVSGNAPVATVGSSSGIVTGISPGTASITYTLPTGCRAYVTVTVTATPTITGTAMFCQGTSSTLAGTPSGGTWSSSNTGIAIVGSGSGIVTGIGYGTATISYTMAPGCFAVKVVTVNQAAVISGTLSVCVTGTRTLTATPAGGTWSSSTPSVATIGTSGKVTPVSPGTSSIIYTTAYGCADTAIVTVGDTFSVSICQLAPIATCDSVLSYCSGMTLAVYGGNASATYSWSPTLPAVKTMDGDVAIFTFTALPTTGYYTVTVTNSGGCAAKSKVRIIAASGTCSPCLAFKPCDTTCEGCNYTAVFKTVAAVTLSSSNISASVPGYYYIPANTSHIHLNVSPAPGSVFFMGNDVILDVKNSITLDGVHFFSSNSCKWKGIEVVNDSPTIGQLTIVGNTLIENASVAGVRVTVLPTLATTPTTGNVVVSDSAIFNNNMLGILIDSFKLRSSVHNYPFEIVNSVFTNRQFCGYSIADATVWSDHYPFKWPSANYLKTPTTSETGINPEFNIDAFNGRTGITAGIHIIQSGYTDSTNPLDPSFYGIVIGDSVNPSKFNLFDTIRCGTVVSTSNASFYNNVFRRVPYNTLYPTPGSDDAGGIFADAIGANDMTSVEVLSGTTTRTNNRFYNTVSGIVGNGYYNIASIGSEFNSNYRDVAPFYKNTGVWLKTNRRIGKYTTEKNTILNINHGIKIETKSCSNDDGYISVKKNKLTGAVSSSSLNIGQFGIEFKEDGICGHQSGQLEVIGNHVSGYETGIKTESGKYSINIEYDTVVVLSKPSGNKIGITVGSAAYANSISHNLVYGDIANGGVYTTTGCNGFIIRATTNTSLPTEIACNYVHDVFYGFQFQDTSSVKWHNNVMLRNMVGLWLATTSSPGSGQPVIGDQGDTCHPSDNVWYDDGLGISSWPGWGSGSVYNTLMDGPTVPVAPVHSKLYVRNITGVSYTFKPTYNSGTFAYSVGTTVLNTGNCTLADSVMCAPTFNGVFGTDDEEQGRAAPGGDKGDGLASELRAELSNYSIQPNPSDGNISIIQNTVSDINVKAKVINYAGAVIHKEELNFRGGRSKMNIGKVSPGIYMVLLNGEKGATATFKIVIQ